MTPMNTNVYEYQCIHKNDTILKDCRPIIFMNTLVETMFNKDLQKLIMN